MKIFFIFLQFSHILLIMNQLCLNILNVQQFHSQYKTFKSLHFFENYALISYYFYLKNLSFVV